MNAERTKLRIANLTGRETCHLCDNGLALVARRPQGTGLVDEFGPCPHCEAGEQIEFPRPGSKNWATWGPDGYWRGREPHVFPPPPSGTPLPKAENAARMRLLARRYGGEQVDPLVGLDMRDPSRRMELIARAAAK